MNAVAVCPEGIEKKLDSSGRKTPHANFREFTTSWVKIMESTIKIRSRFHSNLPFTHLVLIQSGEYPVTIAGNYHSFDEREEHVYCVIRAHKG